jgi:ABC-2 type transport system permease protein
MQVFKLYFKLLKSVSTAIILYAVIFAALIVIISSNNGNKVPQYEETKISTALVNYNEENKLTKDFVDYMSKFCEFTDLGDDESDLADALFFRQVEYVITIPYQFGEDFILGKDVAVEKKTVPDSAYSASVDNAINNYMNTARMYLKSLPDITEEELIKYIRQDINKEVNVYIEHTKNQGKDFVFYNSYFNTASYILLSCCLLGVGMIMLTFHNIHIRRRNMVTPMTHKDMNLQLIAGNIIFILGFDLFFIILGIFFNDYKGINGNVLLFWVNMIIYSISALGISYLIAMLVSKKEANEAISYVIPLGFSFISGAFVPQALLGDSVLKLASFTPTYWFVKGNDKIALLTNYSWTNLKDIVFYMLIQVGFAAALFSVALVISKNKSRSVN